MGSGRHVANMALPFFPLPILIRNLSASHARKIIICDQLPAFEAALGGDLRVKLRKGA